MQNFKRKVEEIVESVLENIFSKLNIEDAKKEEVNVKDLIEESSKHFSSDYSIACFKLAKVLRENPVKIAMQIEEEFKNLGLDYSDPTSVIKDVKAENGYVNIWLNKKIYVKDVLDSFSKDGIFIGRDKNAKKEKVLVEYSSPNIAKEFHIGHLKTTLIGEMLYRLFKYKGDDVVSINHLGDYGTQFGKLIEGYLRWKDEYDFNNNPLEILNDIYVRISNLCKEDEEVLEKCRDNFKKLEDGDPEFVEIWEEFVKISLDEFFKIYDILNVSFDEIKGEASYSKDLPKVVEILNEKGVLKDSKGAKIIEFDDEKLEPALILKSNGSTLYITRDIAAALYRIKTYDYDKSIYVVASEQNTHFVKLRKILEMIGVDKKYTEGLIHVPYGMVRLQSGKMSTREGTVIKVKDLLEESITRTEKILDEKEASNKSSIKEKEKKEIARKVGIGAVIFSNLNTQLIKDEVFVWDNVLNFQGGSPYIQYICVRINSILKELGYEKQKDGENPNLLLDNPNLFINYKDNIEKIAGKREDINKELYNELEEDIFKEIHSFKDKINETIEKKEPYILANYILGLSKLFSEYYTKNRIIVEDEEVKNARTHLIYIIYKILEVSLNLFGIEIPDKM